MNIYKKLKEELAALSQGMDQRIVVKAAALTEEEAIGRPPENDYPLAKGKERLMEARFMGARGQAFTDRYGDWTGTVKELLAFPMNDSFERALLVAALNAALCASGDVTDTVHCRDEGPRLCSKKLASFFTDEGLSPPTALVGYQPRLAEALAEIGELRIVDMDEENFGLKKAGTVILSPDKTGQALSGAACAFVTGSTVVNGSIVEFLQLPVPTVFFGVTIAGPARVLGLRRFCAAPLPGITD